MSNIKEQLAKLKDTDIYSLLLFALYKIMDIPEYSALSELAFILDKKSLLQLCACMGGCTITIPTLEELEILIYALLIYQYTHIEKQEYNEAISKIGIDSNMLRKVKTMYIQVSKILDAYEFTPRG